MKESLIEFIKSGDKEFRFETLLPIRTIENILVNELNFNSLKLNGEETNGWQIDFWYKFDSEKYGKYMLSGSLHYGNFHLVKI